MIMLFHDAVSIAVAGAHEKMIPFGPPQRFAEVFAHPEAKVVVCKPCADARGINEGMLVDNCTMGGMNDFHKETSRPDCKVIAF